MVFAKQLCTTVKNFGMYYCPTFSLFLTVICLSGITSFELNNSWRRLSLSLMLYSLYIWTGFLTTFSFSSYYQMFWINLSILFPCSSILDFCPLSSMSLKKVKSVVALPGASSKSTSILSRSTFPSVGKGLSSSPTLPFSPASHSHSFSESESGTPLKTFGSFLRLSTSF